jgi:ABC-type uncharacterized transport system substrate-binding protein
MTGRKMYYFAVAVLLLFRQIPASAQAAPYKVLVVMSYEVDFPWVKAMTEGIQSVLGDTHHLKYFYMDTKINHEGGPQKAKEAYAIYQEFRPDGVIVADDDGQSMFVVPYLKDKVKTPVMFCGVNAMPEEYGYPASNVSGILERPHFAESIVFAKQLVPEITTFGFIIKDSPTGRAHLNQLQREAGTYSAVLSEFKMPKTTLEVVDMTKELEKKSDALFVAALAGIVNEKGQALPEKEGIKMALKAFGNKPTIGADADYTVKYGALCAVVRTGQEQGRTAAKMLLQAMTGTPVSNIPITQNHNGKRIINVTVMKALGIKPRPEILRGAELVKTEE